MKRPAFRLALVGGLLLALGLIGLPRTGPAQSQAVPTPLPLYALPNPSVDRAFTGGSLAILPDGRTVVVANPLSNSVTVAIPTLERVIAELPVGREPRAVAVTSPETSEKSCPGARSSSLAIKTPRSTRTFTCAEASDSKAMRLCGPAHSSMRGSTSRQARPSSVAITSRASTGPGSARAAPRST